MSSESDEIMILVVREAESLRDPLISAGFVFELDRWFNHSFEAHRIEVARGMGATEKVEIISRAIMEDGKIASFWNTAVYRIFPTGATPISVYTKEFSVDRESILDQVEECRKFVIEHYSDVIDWKRHREILNTHPVHCACCGESDEPK